jgi:hypothetical protein
MDRKQATNVMARLAATFSATTITEDVAEIWYESALQGIDYDLGLRVARRLADTQSDPWLPTPARFSEVRRAVEADVDPARQLPSEPPNVARNLAGVRAARDALRAARAGR